MQDNELIHRALNGDNPAFAELITRHYEVLFALAVGIMHNRDIAEDVLQDGFIQIYQNLEQLNDPAKFRAWAYTIIKRKCLIVLKKRKTEPISISDLPESEEHILTHYCPTMD